MNSTKVKIGGKYLLLLSYVSSLDRSVTFGSEVEVVRPEGHDSGNIYFRLPSGEIGNVADDGWFVEITPEEISKAQRYNELKDEIAKLKEEQNLIYP